MLKIALLYIGARFEAGGAQKLPENIYPFTLAQTLGARVEVGMLKIAGKYNGAI